METPTVISIEFHESVECWLVNSGMTWLPFKTWFLTQDRASNLTVQTAKWLKKHLSWANTVLNSADGQSLCLMGVFVCVRCSQESLLSCHVSLPLILLFPFLLFFFIDISIFFLSFFFHSCLLFSFGSPKFLRTSCVGSRWYRVDMRIF